VVTVNAQNIVLDNFDGGAKAWQEGVYTGDAFSIAPATNFAVVENPWPDGINDSEKSGEFTNPGEAVAFSIAIGKQIYFSKYPKLKLTAMAMEENEQNRLQVVVYNDVDGYKASGVNKTFTIIGEQEWNVIDLDLSSFPSKPGYYNTIGFLFNPSWEENDKQFVLDEIVLEEATTTIQETLLRETFGYANSSEGYWIEPTRYSVEGWGRFTSASEAEISSTNAEGMYLRSLWGVQEYTQPYKDCDGIALVMGPGPGEKVSFSNINIKNISEISLDFGYLFWTDWNWNDDHAVTHRPGVEARVDGGEWVALTTESAFPADEKIINKTSEDAAGDEGYQVRSWFLLHYPIALTGNKLDIRYTNDAATEWDTYCVDNIVLKGNLQAGNGLKNVLSTQANAFVNNDVLTVVSDTNVKEIAVYTVAGSKLTSNRNSATLNISRLPKGVYIASVVMEDNQKTTVKFVK
jgi:hypothetical protein